MEMNCHWKSGLVIASFVSFALIGKGGVGVADCLAVVLSSLTQLRLERCRQRLRKGENGAMETRVSLRARREAQVQGWPGKP